jgi:phosphate transport system substrate-binding protein
MYLVVSKPPGKPLDNTLSEFIRFILSKQGQQVVVDHGVFVPLRAAQVQASREARDKETVALARPGGIDPK